jgi:hypothetical protein
MIWQFIWIFLLSFVCGQTLNAETISAEKSLIMIQSKDKQAITHSIRSQVAIYQGSCQLKLVEQIRTVSYYSLSCGRNSISSLIHFGRKSSHPQTKHWRIAGLHQIGKKEYTEIVFLPESGINYRSIPSKPEKFSSERANPNLTYFIELLASPSENISIEPNLEIFFDRSCPLKYINSNHDFYWDDRIYHDFEITCSPKGELAYMRISGNHLGEILIGNKLVQDIPIGKMFLANIRLLSWKRDRLEWGEARFYEYK